MYFHCHDGFVRLHKVACCLTRLLLALVALVTAITSRAADDSNSAKFCDCGGSAQVKETSPAKEAVSVPPKRRVLRVAADPNNLPLSNDKGEGFENKLAQLLAKELDADLQ